MAAGSELEPWRVVAVAGSLRQGSFNRALLRAASELAPSRLALETHVLDDIPPYNEDVRTRGYPPPVDALRRALGAAHGLLIATPEYNHGIPGVLKNAIDWISRPPDQAFEALPVGIVGATPGGLGTRAAQYQLRQVLTPLNAYVMPQPMIMIPGAEGKFDAELRLVDTKTRERMERFLVAFASWIERFRATRA